MNPVRLPYPMDQNPQNHPGDVPQPSADFGMVRNDAEGFGTFPNGSEDFRTVRKDAESFRSIPKGSERKEHHTLTVREAAKKFEEAGVARTERSIVNWCQPNRQGISRLDGYFDPNERRYYITLQSVELAIAEEKVKVDKTPVSEPVGNVPKDAERPEPPIPHASESQEIEELEKEIRDLEITNRGKDYFIGRLERERDGFFEQLLTASRKVGELETKLLQLEGPKPK
jgi:hypothetical protein